MLLTGLAVKVAVSKRMNMSCQISFRYESLRGQAYSKVTMHLSQIAKVCVLNLLGKQDGEFQEARQYLPMREGIGQDIPQEYRTL